MSTIKLDITEGQINNAIAVALAEAFSQEKKDSLIRDIIRSHLSMTTDTWSKETIFSKSVNSKLGEMVKEQLDKEVEELRPIVEDLVKEVFGSKIKINIIDQLKYQLKRVVLSNLKLSVTVDNND